jgi:hypothetical protein
MRSLSRAATAVALHAFDGVPSNREVGDFLRAKGWEDDRIAGLLTRATSAPALASQAQWAGEFATVTLAFLESLKPMSAAAQLIGQSLRLDLGNAASLKLPAIDAGSAGWTAEGQPIRVVKMISSSGPTLVPRKLASIIELTREMMESSSIEDIVRTALVDSTAPALDASMFSSAAADTTRPAGILVGATVVTPSAGTIASEAMADDLAALVGAIAAYSGSGSIAIVAAPAQATRIGLVAERPPFPVLMSSSLAAGTAIALATNALAVTIEPIRLDAAKSITVHEETTSPLPVGSALPSRSTFQTDTVALRMKFPVSWCVRDARAVSSVVTTKW